jgi:hypothetical protein
VDRHQVSERASERSEGAGGGQGGEQGGGAGGRVHPLGIADRPIASDRPSLRSPLFAIAPLCDRPFCDRPSLCNRAPPCIAPFFAIILCARP